MRELLQIHFWMNFALVSGTHNANDEQDLYLADSVNKVSFSEILNWWKTSSSSYPKLLAIARKYLAIPATSALSESSFRYAGLTVTDLRNKLSPENVSNLLFVRNFQDDA